MNYALTHKSQVSKKSPDESSSGDFLFFHDFYLILEATLILPLIEIGSN